MKPTRLSVIALSSLLLAALVGAASPVIPAGATPAPTVSENFSGTAFAPANWANPDGGWVREAACAEIDGSPCASIAGPQTNGVNRLVLPAFSTDNLTSPALKFDVYVSDPGSDIIFSVHRDRGGWDGLWVANAPVPMVHGPGTTGGTKRQISIDLDEGQDYVLGLAFSEFDTGGFARVDNVTVTGDFHNSPPVATDNPNVQVNEDGAVPITLQGHDTDGGNVTFAIATPPAHGTLAGTAPNLTYQPAANFSGADTFTFKTNDGTDDSAPATVTINVISINDAPVVAGPSAVTTTPGTPVFFQSAFSNALSFIDPDAGLATMSAYLVSSGTMTLGRTTGLTFTNGDGTADTAMNFTGTLPAINAALDGMWVAAPTGGGNFNLTLGIDDGGASGGGPARQVERTVPITVSNVATYQVDALVASQGTDIAGATGDGIRVGPTAAVPDSQRVTLPTADPWSFQKASLWVQNDGNQLERFKITATAGDTDVDVGYLVNGADLASAIKAGTAFTNSLSPGQASRIEVQFRVSQTPKNTSTRTYKVTVSSEHDSGSSDSVEFVLPLLGVAQPDLSVKSNQIDDPFEATPKNQPKGATVLTDTGTDPTITNALQVNGSASTFDVGLDNLGSSDGRVMVRSSMRMLGFDYRLYLVEGSVRTDVTALTGGGGGFPVELASKAKKHLTAEVFSVPSQYFQSPYADLTITASALGNDQGDQVIIRTIQMKPGVDLAIAGPGQTLAGGVGATNPSDSTQLRSADVAAGEGAEFRIDARNAVDVGVPSYPERIAWTTSGAPAGWTVDYFAGTTNVTAAVVGNTYMTDVAAKGIGSADPTASLRVVVTPGASVRPGDVATVRITGRSTRSTAATPPSDTVTASVRMGYQVDALVGPAGGPFLGDGVVNTTAAGQTASQTVKIGTDGLRTVRIRNSGAIGDRYKLTVPSADITGPGAVVTLMSGGSKLTDTVQTAAGATFDLAPGSSADVIVTVRPDGQMGPGSTRDVTLTVSSVNHPGVKPDVVKVSTVVGQIDCAPQTVAFDNIKLSGNCILTTDLGYVSNQPMDVNGLHFTFPAGAAGIVYKSQAWVIPKYATQYVPWFRSTHTVMSFKDATLYDGPLDMRMGGSGSTTLAAIGAKGSLNGLSLQPGAQLLVAFPPDKAGKVSLEVPLLPPALFAQRNAAPQVITTDADGGGQVPLTMTWPQLTYSTIGMVDFKATYDPATDTWTGFGRMGFPGGLYFPAITTVMKFAGASGQYKLTYLFGRLAFGSAEPQVAPLITLKQLEAMYDQANGVFYGKATFNALPITSALNAQPGTQLAKLPGNVFGLDGKFAYLDGPQTLTLQGTVSLLGLLNLGGASFTAGPTGMRATGNLNYTIDLGPLGVAGLTGLIDGGISYASGFQIGGTGNVVIGGANVGTLNLILSNKGAAGCGSVFGAAAGFGFDWGSTPTIFGSCDLSPWQVDGIPAHADFSAIQGQITTMLNKVDDVQRLMGALPGAVQQQLGL